MTLLRFFHDSLGTQSWTQLMELDYKADKHHQKAERNTGGVGCLTELERRN